MIMRRAKLNSAFIPPHTGKTTEGTEKNTEMYDANKINKDTFYYKVNIKAPEDAFELISAALFEHGSTGMEEKEDELIAYFSEKTEEKKITDIIKSVESVLKRAEISGSIDYNINRLPIKDWGENWKKSIKPIRVGKKLIILAPWHRYNGKRLRIVIEPGMAFGTGYHATTRICLERLEVASDAEMKSFLDIGTGSGILAIAAKKLGFKDVVATDIDPIAIEVAEKNIKNNEAGHIDLLLTDTHELKGTFSFVAVNITAEAIKYRIDDILRFCNKKAVLTGILKEQGNNIIQLLKTKGIKHSEIIRKDEWIGILFNKR